MTRLSMSAESKEVWVVLSPEEKNEIHQAVYRDLIEIEAEITRHAGSYQYLCLLEGEPTFCHRPVGPVIRHIAHLECEVA
jgi:hypothetical protein